MWIEHYYMSNLLIICGALFLLYTFFSVSHSFKGLSLLNNKPDDYKTIKTNLNSNDFFSIILDICLHLKYTLEVFDIEKGVIILSEETTIMHSGYFFPLYFKNSDNELIIEVAAKSKWIVKDIHFKRHHNQIYSILSMAIINKNNSFTGS